MVYLGDFKEDSTVYVYLTTNDSNGASVAPSSSFEAADILIYKNDSNAQKTTTNGITMTSPFDSVTGLHQVSIDTANDTGDASFWVAGADYSVVLSPDETIAGQTVVKVLAQFSLENRANAPTKTITESYATDGSAATQAQLLYMIWSLLAERNISGTTLTAKKIDGTTNSMTFTLDSATAPTTQTRAT